MQSISTIKSIWMERDNLIPLNTKVARRGDFCFTWRDFVV